MRQIAHRASYSPWLTAGLIALAEEAQQELEHVDEVQIEAERPHDGRFADHVRAGDLIIGELDALRTAAGQGVPTMARRTLQDVIAAAKESKRDAPRPGPGASRPGRATTPWE